MIRWIVDDKNCEPRKKTSLKSVVRKSQVTGDVCPENIHPRSLLIARSNTHTHTIPPKVHDPFHRWWPVFDRTFVFTYVRVEGISTDEYRRYNSKLSSNIKHLSNWCGQEMEGGGGDEPAARCLRASEGGRCTSSTMVPPPVKWSYECLPRYYVWVWPVIYAP